MSLLLKQKFALIYSSILYMFVSFFWNTYEKSTKKKIFPNLVSKCSVIPMVLQNVCHPFILFIFNGVIAFDFDSLISCCIHIEYILSYWD